jgi:toxin ParE2
LKPLNVLEPAEAEYREILSWYRERNVRVAARFAVETGKTLAMIERFPQIGSRVPGINDRDVRRMSIHTFPYQIVFVELPDRLDVVAFAHDRRRPTYFLNRIRR